GPKDIEDPQLFHALSLAAFLAWVGLGADGLSSSSYGPEEAFKNLGDHRYLAVFLALSTAIAVFIISAAYTTIIEHFPCGGGGYIVTSRLIGPRAGVVSGAALLIDHVLTCTTSVAAGGEAIFSNFPREWHVWKLPVELVAIAALTILNLRGVKESIRVLLPIFLTFLLTHVILIGGSVGFHLGRADEVARNVSNGLSHDLGTMGFIALALLFLRAYSLGAGTYTGIEAVSNGLSIMREPRVLTGKRTMVYMSTSLAVTAGGIILGYLLMNVHPAPGKTMNYVLAEMLAGGVQLAPERDPQAPRGVRPADGDRGGLLRPLQLHPRGQRAGEVRRGRLADGGGHRRAGRGLHGDQAPLQRRLRAAQAARRDPRRPSL